MQTVNGLAPLAFWSAVQRPVRVRFTALGEQFVRDFDNALEAHRFAKRNRYLGKPAIVETRAP